MALQSTSHPMFAQVPDEFFSPFPSNDSLMSGKYQALTRATSKLSEELATMQQAKAFNITLQILQKTRATKAGDLLTDWLPEIAWFKEEAGVKLLQGIFAEVPWTKTSDPQQLVEDMGRVGLDVALTAMAAVPIYGTIASALVSGGRLLYRLMAAHEEKVLALPWAEYSKDTDEEICTQLRDDVFPEFDWTTIFLPPFDDVPWRIGEAKEKGLVFGPLRTGDKDLAWSVNYGCMPGTLRVAGQTQSIVTQPGDVASHLVRNLRHPKGVTPKTVPIDWRSTVIACGDYFPSLAQVGAVTWQQCMRAGSPVMYCLDVEAIDTAWKNYWDNFYASAWDVYRNAGPLLKIPPFFQFQATRLASELVEPYICVRRTPTSDWQLGIPFGGFRPNALVHPGIFKHGAAEKDFRNPCLFVETDTAKKASRYNWPYGGKPEQHGSLRGGRYAYNTTPATTEAPPDGYRCMPWPPPEAAAAEYAPVYETFIKPAVQALRDRQVRCLSSTLVCAYTRPVAVDKLPAYAAFDKNPKLRQLCLDVREKLLKHDARFMVNLKDVDDIDPKFAAALRKSGVNNSFGQKQGVRDRLGAADLTGDDAPMPPAPPPGGGVAFQDLAPAPPPPRSLLKLAAGATGVAAAAAGYIWIRRRNQHGISQ
jgi:hypothetical protein